MNAVSVVLTVKKYAQRVSVFGPSMSHAERTYSRSVLLMVISSSATGSILTGCYPEILRSRLTSWGGGADRN
jgi:hypothetical protein